MFKDIEELKLEASKIKKRIERFGGTGQNKKYIILVRSSHFRNFTEIYWFKCYRLEQYEKAIKLHEENKDNPEFHLNQLLTPMNGMY